MALSISFTVITVYMSSEEEQTTVVLLLYAHILFCGVGRSCPYLLQSLLRTRAAKTNKWWMLYCCTLLRRRKVLFLSCTVITV